MRIKDFNWTHQIGHRPEVELRLFDVTSDELAELRVLSARGDKIKIESKEYSNPIAFADIHTDDGIYRYPIRDVEVTSKMFDNFARDGMRGLRVKKVIFNKPATIVFWNDGTKSVVVCRDNDEYDTEKGFYIACTKKLFGNNHAAVGRMNKALDMAKEGKNDT